MTVALTGPQVDFKACKAKTTLFAVSDLLCRLQTPQIERFSIKPSFLFLFSSNTPTSDSPRI